MNMKVLENVKFFNGDVINMVLRDEVADFWQQCISMAADGHRVCAVGNPGIGKSTTMPYLFRLLLKETGDTVVYHYRGSGWYFHYVVNSVGSVKTTIFPESVAAVDVPGLNDSSTFYLIDPGKTNDSCDPADSVLASVIICPSCDSSHWGGSEFIKVRSTPMGQRGGIMLYMGVWTFEDISNAAKYLCRVVPPADELLQRFRQFGGVPRWVLAIDIKQASIAQQIGIKALSYEHAKSIATDDVSALDTADRSQPSSWVMGYVSEPPSFNMHGTVVISEFVHEEIWSRHLGSLWSEMLRSKDSDTFGHAFEAYVRNLMVAEHQFERRRAARASASAGSSMWKQLSCHEIRQSTDIVRDVQSAHDGVVFHSVSAQHPLIDFIFKFRAT